MDKSADRLLSIKGLSIRYHTEDGVVYALTDASIDLLRGETLGIVGETGAGKTTLAKGVMRLIPKPPGKIESGEVFYEGRDLLRISEREMRKVRGAKIAMIFQDPMTSLNPVMSVVGQIAEVIRNHFDMRQSEAHQRALEMLDLVGISAERADEFPHQFSGGMKQRVMIAIALACNPALLIADEPTTALDVTIQLQVLELIRNLKERLNTSVLLITHDLGIVAQNCDRVCIMYAGEVVERGLLREVFKNTAHPYTRGLLESIPIMTTSVDRLKPIRGSAPDPTNLPEGCKFFPRCDVSIPECARQPPKLVQLSDTHSARCILCTSKEA